MRGAQPQDFRKYSHRGRRCVREAVSTSSEVYLGSCVRQLRLYVQTRHLFFEVDWDHLRGKSLVTLRSSTLAQAVTFNLSDFSMSGDRDGHDARHQKLAILYQMSGLRRLKISFESRNHSVATDPRWRQDLVELGSYLQSHPHVTCSVWLRKSYSPSPRNPSDSAYLRRVLCIFDNTAALDLAISDNRLLVDPEVQQCSRAIRKLDLQDLTSKSIVQALRLFPCRMLDVDVSRALDIDVCAIAREAVNAVSLTVTHSVSETLPLPPCVASVASLHLRSLSLVGCGSARCTHFLACDFPELKQMALAALPSVIAAASQAILDNRVPQLQSVELHSSDQEGWTGASRSRDLLVILKSTTYGHVASVVDVQWQIHLEAAETCEDFAAWQHVVSESHPAEVTTKLKVDLTSSAELPWPAHDIQYSALTYLEVTVDPSRGEQHGWLPPEQQAFAFFGGLCAPNLASMDLGFYGDVSCWHVLAQIGRIIARGRLPSLHLVEVWINKKCVADDHDEHGKVAAPTQCTDRYEISAEQRLRRALEAQHGVLEYHSKISNLPQGANGG